MTTETRRARTNAANARNWYADAACRDVDPELFFPIGHGPASRRQVADAKQVCGRCPVRQQCLEWSLETRQAAGIWGGLTEDERRDVAGRIEQTQTERCWNRQEWIEEQQAAGVPQRTIAEQLGVTRSTLSRCIVAFAKDRAATAGAGVAA